MKRIQAEELRRRNSGFCENKKITGVGFGVGFCENDQKTDRQKWQQKNPRTH